MERSYKMAAKYLNPEKDTIKKKKQPEKNCRKLFGTAGGAPDHLRPFTAGYGFCLYRFARR